MGLSFSLFCFRETERGSREEGKRGKREGTKIILKMNLRDDKKVNISFYFILIIFHYKTKI